jgi:fibronectin type 3 domain-containing protein
MRRSSSSTVRTEQNRTPRRMRLGAVVSSFAMIASGLVVTAPAAALPLADVPPDPATWAAAPYSPLAPDAIAVAENTAVIEFDATEGGLHGSGDVDTGFTMVQPSTSDPAYYLPQNITVAGGALTIAPTNGIAYLVNGPTGGDVNKNKQDNTLGVGVDSAGKALRLSTVVTVPGNAEGSAQGGLWFGPDDDNYLKLVVAGNSSTGRQIQLSREIAGATDTTAPTADQVTLQTNTGTITGTTKVTLNLDVDAVAGQARASYQIGTGAVTNLGQVALPANFADGSLIDDSVPVTGFGGVFATKRNMAESAIVPFTFDRFTVGELDTTAPAAPMALGANASTGENVLTWNAPGDGDVAGYRVYRHPTENPVSPSAANLISGAAPISATTLTDSAVFVGQGWNYSVVAVDTSGNISSPATVQATTPPPSGSAVAKVDFTTVQAAAQPGYTKDAGAPYSEGAGFGWITADDGAPFDFALNTRVRAAADGTSDPRLLSLIHMQYGLSSGTPNPAVGIVTEQGVWEYDLPDGRYNVVVAVGDTSLGNFDSTHAVTVEGETVVSAFVGSPAVPFEQGVAEVEITDGRLTLAPTGGTNTKVSFIEVYELELFGPGAPADLTATLSSETDSVELAWESVDGATGYNVYRADASPVPTDGAPLNAEPLTTTEFVDDTVVPGHTYHYTVTALADGLPASAPATEASVTTPSEATAPTAPVGVTATPGEADIALAWDAVDGALGYQVYRGATSDVATTGTALSGETALTTTSFLDTTAVPGLEYFYVVVAIGAEELVSDPSAAVSATIEEDLPPTQCSATEWSADYFGGREPAGAVIASECLAELEETLAAGVSPMAGVPADNYSARFARTIDEGAGSYTFTALADDGIRVFVDGVQIINRWSYSASPVTATVSLTDGPHLVVVEYYQGYGAQRITLDYEVTLTECTAAEWAVDYFAGRDLQGAPLTSECLGELDESYAGGVAPAAGVPADNYSARFTRTISGPAGSYTFTALADDGVRVFVDGEKILERWSYSSAPLATTVPLAAGDHDIVVEYFQGYGGKRISLDHEIAVNECTADQWSADYFGGRNLAGAAVATKCLTDLDEAYAGGVSPAPGVSADNYSARFTKTIDEGAGSYEFTVLADDGVRVLVGGVQIMERWSYAAAPLVATVSLADGPHEIVVEYFQGYGTARLALDYEITVTGCDPTEWSADYFGGRELAGAVIASECLAELEETLAGGSSPMAGVPADNYSARFARTIDEGAGSYTFTAIADDGIRVFVDGVQIINRWSYATGALTATASLTDGPHLVVVEYYQGYGTKRITLDYEKEGADTEAPEAPADLLAWQLDLGIATSWTASSSTDVEGYNVYRGTEPGVTAETGTKLNTALVSTTGFQDDAVTPDVTYYYVVTAVDAAGNESEASNESAGIWETVPDTEAPDAPTGVAAVPGDGEVALTWTASAAADTVGYTVYRSIVPGAVQDGEIVSGAVPLVDTSFVDAGVTNGTTYFYAVVAVDLSGNTSAASNEAITVPRVPNTADLKVDFTATNGVPAAGYAADWGQAYGPRSSAGQGAGLTYGWVDADGHELSLVGNGRDRGRAGVDERLDSVIHMQYGDVDGGTGTNGIKTEGIWEIAVPDGLYEVTVGVGDEMGGTGYDSLHVINVEGSIAINGFQGSAAQEYTTLTTTVGVWDGRLTIDPVGGTNTKPGYVEILGVPFDRPHVETVFPQNRVVDADVNGGVAAAIKVPYAGFGVDDTTMPGNVKVYRVADGAEIAGSTNTSGGNDTVNFAPDVPFAPATQYRFEVTAGVTDLLGNPWVPFTSVFTTGAGQVDPGTGEFDPLTNIAFEKVELPIGAGKYWASFAFGPDGKLYGSTIGQGLFRYTVAADGTLSNEENLGYQGIAIIGLLFDESSTAGSLKLWITNTSANVGNELNQWASGISLLTGPNLENRKQVFHEMPRSLSDHLTNSMVYGPGGDIYVLQGSNQAAGDLDNSWGQRGEQLLTAALLHFDPEHARVQQAIADAQGDDPLSVKTAQGGTYNPYAAGAPLKIYASGIRNAYDLVFHSNGHIYVPTNGTAGGGNSPGVTYNAATGTFTRVAAAGIPGFSTVNGQDLTAACQARDARDPSYTPRSVPAISNHPTQRDHLYDVVQGGYYGHPNPTRCEFVLHEGNDPANPPQWAGQGGSKYASGVLPESHYEGVAYDFEFNKSPNGALEYQSNTFDGQLKGRIVVARFSNNNDLIFLQADPVTGKILGGQTEVGITGVPDTTMQGVGGFNDPLEVVEDVRNGNMYVNQYDRSGSQQKLFLLRVPASQQAEKITSSVDELVFSAAKSNAGNATAAQKTDVESITVTNQGTESTTFSATIGGAHTAEFAVEGGVPSTLAAGATATFQVRFTPGTTVGQRSAQLTLAGGDGSVTVGLYGLSTNGIEGGNEPTLQNVLGTLGFDVDAGWTTLAGGMEPTAKGDEILEPLFVKSGTAAVTWKPLAHYAPNESIPFGWYIGDGTPAERTQVGAISSAGYQSLLPPMTSASTPTFDPGSATFGFYYFSQIFNRYGFTEDRLNSPAQDAHRARIYPAANRNGVAIPNSYIVAFEDASNGDYQDYMFLVSGIRPVTDTGSGGDEIKVDFTTAAGDLAAGYIRDHGQAYGPRTAADQGSGLTYGWKNQTTEVDLDISVGGSTPGNGRDRQSSQPDMRLDSIMHMQPTDVAGTFNGTNVDAFWEIALPDGTYEVTVGVGDPAVGTDPEVHVINAENAPLVTPFIPSGVAGAATRHTIVTSTVEVTDGALTLDALGGTNTKIAFVDVVPTEIVDPGGDDPSDGAQVKVTFQPSGTPVPAGWTAETGGAFSEARGFGWLDAATSQPVDRTIATRYRTAPLGGIAFPSDPRQLGLAFLDNATQPTYTSGVWEYAVPNGEYEVGVSVGDANYIDSTHGVQVEGQPIIASFVPTASTPFQLGVRDVTVTDGRLTITNSGTNTKINWLSIKGDGLEPGGPVVPLAKIDFRPGGTTVPSGWTADTGSAYSDAQGFGWLVGGVPTDRGIMTRNRLTPTAGIAYPTGDPTRQSLILMQATTTSGSPITGGTVGVWEHALANGTYTVSASVGDAGFLDSVHGVSAEGSTLVSNFTPSGATPFASGTATVLVTDGKLTLTATGVNTKLNWVTIEGQGITNPTIGVSANGSPVAATYSGGTAIVTANAVAASGATIESFTYSINDGPDTAYSGPITLDDAGTQSVQFTATDSEERTTTRTVTFEILDIGGTVALANQQVVRQADGTPLPGLYEDLLVTHRINSGTTTHTTTEQATVNVTNTGAKDLRIASLTLGGTHGAQFQIIAPTGEFPVFLEPGQTLPVTVQFIGNSGSKGVRFGTLTIASSDPESPSTVVQLRGGYMGAPEGGSELTLQQIFTLFGSTTSTGSSGDSLGNGSEMPGAPMDGDEVRSYQWKKLDTSKPVQAVQLGAFHGCCGQSETITINGTSATHAVAYGQAIYPLTSGGAKVALTTNPGGNFGITISGQSTTQTAYMAVKMWPVEDATGKPIPGAWFAGHDYISSPNQCGVGATNCDYQDNVYLITNILPVASSDTIAPAAPAAPEGEADSTGVELTWTASADADLIGYRVERSSAAAGPWVLASGTGLITGTSFRDNGAAAGPTTYYRVVAVDASGNQTAGASASVDTSSITAAPIRINAGGPALTLGGVSWAADTNFSGGKSFSNTAIADILGTTNDQLYRTERSALTGPGSFSYAIPVPSSGQYQVTLHFAEIWHGATNGGPGGTGKRVFSVNMEGGPVEISNLDLNAQVAPMTAYLTNHTIGVTDGTLNIGFSSTVDQPKVSGIEIVKVG